MKVQIVWTIVSAFKSFHNNKHTYTKKKKAATAQNISATYYMLYLY
jgi:hypothetical protein